MQTFPERQKVIDQLNAKTGVIQPVLLRPGQVDTQTIRDATITTAKIGDAQITTAKIANLAVTSAQIADASITSAKIQDLAVTTADIADAAITTAKIQDATITTAKIGDAQITDAKVFDLSADKITAGTLDATTTLTAKLTAQAGAGKNRVEISPTGIQLFDSANLIVVDLPTATGSTPYFKGTVVATGLDVTGNATLRGTASSLPPSALLQIASGHGDPNAAPSFQLYWPTTTDLANTQDHFGLFYDPAGGAAGTTPTFFTTYPQVSGGYYRLIGEFDATTGAKLREIDLGVGNDAWGVVRVGTFVYVLWSPNDTTQWNIRTFNQATLAQVGADTDVSAKVNHDNPGLGYDGTNLIITTTINTTSATRIRLQKYSTGATPTFVSALDLDATFVVDGRAGSNATEFGGIVKITEAGVNAGAAVYWLAIFTYRDASNSHRGVFPFDAATGAIVANESFNGPEGAESDGLAHDGTNFWSQVNNGPVTQHSNWDWTTASNVYWAGYTWYDSAGTTHESKISPRVSLVVGRRNWAQITTATIPSGGADDPNRARIYVLRGATDTGPGTYKRQGATLVGATDFSMSTYDSAGVADPATNTFGVTTPGAFKGTDPSTANENTWSMDGSGKFVLPQFLKANKPVAGVEGRTVYEHETDGLLVDNGAAWVPVETMVGCRVSKSATQAVAAAAVVALTWDTEDYDTHAFHDNATNTSRFTIPTGLDGRYLIVAQLSFDSSTHNNRMRTIARKNGVATNLLTSVTVLHAVTGGHSGFPLVGFLDLVAGDYIEIYADCPDEQVIFDGPAPASCYAEIRYCGPKVA